MELSDYVRMLRRGWPTIVALTALFLALTAGYLAVAPKSYQAVATVLVTTTDGDSAGALQTGSQFGSSTAATYADVIDSAIVMAKVADQLRPQDNADDLLEMVTTDARSQTSVIDIAATGNSPERVADVANATAVAAGEVLPTLGRARGESDAPVEIQVIQRAVPPKQALSPDTRRTIAVGLVIGLCVGLAVTIAFQALDTRLRRPEDVARVTGARVLAALPQLRRSQRRSVVVRDDPTGPTGEAYRSLRTNLSFTEAEGRRSLLFTPAVDDRDSAQVPLNLAWSLTQAGHSVVVVDLDFRQKAIASLLGLNNWPGVVEVLAGTTQLSDIVKPSDHQQLDVIVSGTLPPSPSDLLSSPRLPALLAKLEEYWDFVVVHAPPLLASTDAAIISRVAGWTVVTVSAGRTRSTDLSTALATLANVGVDPAGLVIAGARRTVRENRRLRGPLIRARVTPPLARIHHLSSDPEVGRPSRRASE